MRIRSIKPEFWRSEDITALAWNDRLLFIGLWSYVDDNGVGLDKLAAITADLFAGDIERDSSEAFERVSRGLQKLSDAGRITRYTVEGKRYLHITNWEKHQRIDKPNKERYPLPTRENTESSEALPESSREYPESPAPGTEEQGNRGTVKKTCASPKVDDATFNEFWNLYPRKKGKDKARESLTKALKKSSIEEIMAGLRAHLPEWEGKEPDFVPYPATWLNQGRWQDEVTTAAAQGEEINPDKVLGPDYWSCPDPPAGLSMEDELNWRREQRANRQAERLEQAKQKLGGNHAAAL